MFSQLLSQCQQVFKSASVTIKQNKQILKQSRKFTQQQPYGIIDPTKTAANCISFPKSQRFKQIEKQQINLNDMSMCQSITTENQSQGNNKKNSFSFKKSQRFLENKQEQKKSILYPNYQVVKRNNKNAPVIKPPSAKDLGKSNVSIMTAATMNQVGPGKYFVQNTQSIQKSKKVPAFSKQKRFPKAQITYQDTPLYINQTQTRRRPPTSAILKKKLPLNSKLISLQQQQQLRQRLKLTYWNTIPLQLDRIFKNKSSTVIKQDYFNIKTLKGTQKRCAILMMLDRLNWLRGGFENNLQKNIVDERKCVVKYRKSTPKPFKFTEMQPGPDYYYPQDDLIKPNAIGYSFNKQGIQPVKPKYDYRDYDINEQLFKKGGNIVINPLPLQHKLTDEQIKSLQLGPGYYDCLFKQVQKRTDVGAVKYQEINQKNARQNNMLQVKQVNDAVYFPNYTAIDPNVPTLLYKQPANVKPMHLPQKLLFPEHWVFYDGNLNKVKAQIAKNIFLAKNMQFSQYQQYTKKFQAFKQYLKQRQPIPEVGEYNVNYKQIDAHVQGFDLAKMEQKTLIQPIVKQQGQVDGDNLIINPKLLQNHLPNFNFGKLVGREHLQQQNKQFEQPKQGDRLILQPKLLQKKLPNIKFQNYIGRQQLNDNLNIDQPVQGNVLILNPKPIQKHIPQIKMDKQSQKHQPQIGQIYDDKQELVLNLDKPKKVKGFVQMERMSVVRLVPQLKKVKQTMLKLKSKKNIGENNEDE